MLDAEPFFRPWPAAVPFMLDATKESCHWRPLRMSRRPSMAPTCVPMSTFQKRTWPDRHDAAQTSFSLGSNRTHVMLEAQTRASAPPPLSPLAYRSHTRMFPSQLPLMSCPGCEVDGENCSDFTGDVWPVRTSSMLPVWIDQTYIAYLPPLALAATISPPPSMPRLRNWQSPSGLANVRKFRYRSKSNARTEPSWLALTTAFPWGVKHTAVTGAVCSANVTKHRPLCALKSFTLPS
mmetsp:Transcript_79814/g.225943  ORF Transcript_79814/g.225943 Transcript_79814/m.225943 type:complete len:236 (+) Transcript_79814:823-1530(+)